jgi:hypothetical protein
LARTGEFEINDTRYKPGASVSSSAEKSKSESQLQNSPQHGKWAHKVRKGAQAFPSSFPDFLSNKIIMCLGPGCLTLRKAGSQEMKLESQSQNASTQTWANKIQKGAQPFVFFAFFVVKFLVLPLAYRLALLGGISSGRGSFVLCRPALFALANHSAQIRRRTNLERARLHTRMFRHQLNGVIQIPGFED